MGAHNIGLLFGIIILIIMMVICHYSNRRNLINWNYIADRFQNVTTENKIPENKIPENKIQYYGTANCKSLPAPLSCPGQHPMIPCSLIKKCTSKGQYDLLSAEDKKIVDMYVYLVSLLKSVDVYKFSDSNTWFKY